MFDIALSSAVVSAPVTFETPGVVVLGCSIHDFMVGYVLVVPTPFFAVTSASGTAILRNLPLDTHDVYAWHAGAAAPTQALEVAIVESALANAEFRIALKPDGL